MIQLTFCKHPFESISAKHHPLFSILDLWLSSRQASLDQLRTQLAEYVANPGTFQAQIAAMNINNHYLQNSFSLPDNAHVVFLRSTSPFEFANTVDDIPSIQPRTELDKLVLDTYTMFPPLMGRQDNSPYIILCQDIFYEPDRNVVSVKVVKIRELLFKLIQAADCQFVPSDSFELHQYYRIGVVAPLMTRDNRVALMQQREPPIFTSPTITLGPNEALLNFAKRRQNLILKLAERAVLNQGLDATQFGTSVGFDNLAIASISIRQNLKNPHDKRIDFIVPVRLDCDYRQLWRLLCQSRAVEKNVFGSRCLFPSVDPTCREYNLTRFVRDDYLGRFTYEPIVLAAADFFGRDYSNYKDNPPRYLPRNSRTVSHPLKGFQAHPQKALTWSQDMHRQQQGQSHEREEPDTVAQLTDKFSRLTL